MEAKNVVCDPKPKKGDVVTFWFESFSRNAVPVKPTIYRIRTDIAWKDVMHNHAKDISQSQMLNGTSNVLHYSYFLVETSQKAIGVIPFGYWTTEKGKNMRKFFERFAKSRDSDPLLPETWYSIVRSDILPEQV